MRRPRGWATALAIALLAPLAVAEPSGPCPQPSNPKTCASFRTYAKYGWASARYNVVPIPYYINPSQPWMPEDRVIAAVHAALRTWADWNPRLRFEYLGTTDRLPIPWDGYTVIGFMPTLTAGHASATYRGAYIVEGDIALQLASAWDWKPCAQRDGSCTDLHYNPTLDTPVLGVSANDVQNTVTHEAGHMLGLDHPPAAESALTLSGNSPQAPYMRHLNTLGLGDVLGLKKLYPWTCPGPSASASYRFKFRYLCPAIRIFAP